MRIALSDSEARDELVAFFRRRECLVRELAEGVLEVEAHPTLAPDQARMELGLLLRIWQEMHPQVRIRMSE